MAAKKKSTKKIEGRQAGKPIRGLPPPAPTATSDAPSPGDLSQNKHVGMRVGFPVVGVGASAGGLDAFKRFFKAMPANAGMAFVLVPHLDPKHPSLMVELIARQTVMAVTEAEDGQAIEVNHVYIIPPNKFLAIHDRRLRLSVPPEHRGHQTAIDSFFRSLAEEEQERSIAIVLSGTGSHGTPGLKEIKLAGGMAMVQDPASADFDQMPRSAVATGLVDYILTPEQMPEALRKYAQAPYMSSNPAGATNDESSPDLLNRILVLVKARTGYDFRPYRKNMLLRRIQRRMGLSQVERLGSYLDMLREDPAEIIALCEDMLIGVTGFFRDPEAFQVLEQRVLPALVTRKGGEAPLRIWVPGCSTGEEAYSIAMLSIEQFATAKIATNVQIFASDIDEDALTVARRGVYPESVVSGVSAERLRRFFTKSENHSYQVTKRLRDTIVFAPQNLVADAPFSKLDLISCRNLLIYLESEVQKKVISLFHFALSDGGWLFLGPSETVGRQSSLFDLISTRWRVYERSGPARRHLVEIPIDAGASWRQPVPGIKTAARAQPGLAELMQKQLLADYAPASVLINRKFEVLCFQGPTVDYLEFPSGEPTRDLLALTRQGLRTKLRSMVSEAIDKGERIIDTASRVKRENKYCRCHITVEPFMEPRKQSDLFLVIFEEVTEPPPLPNVRPQADEKSSHLNQLENELRATREDLQGTIEELETSNEEMKASNEEMTSMNEELQSVNEELESSKEELQSTNEELVTVNNQLNQKLAELNAANNDISNLLNSTDIPTIFLTTDFRIRRFTPSATKLFHLLASDAGRPIDDVTRKFTDDRLLEDCRMMLQIQTGVEREVEAHNRQSYFRRVLPYLNADYQLEGVAITFIDLTERKRAADLVNAARLYAESIVATVREPLLVVDGSLLVRSANPAFFRTFQIGPDDVVNRPLFSLQDRRWDVQELRQLLENMLSGGADVIDFELMLPSPDGGKRTMLVNARAIASVGGQPNLILLAVEDITERKQAEQELKSLNQTLEDRVSSRTALAESRAEELARSERDLTEQKQILQAVLRSALDGVVVADKQGAFLVYNPAAIDLVGLGPTDLGPDEWQRHYGLFLPDQVTPCPVDQIPLVRAMHGADIAEQRLFVRNNERPDGVWISVTASSLRDDGGAVIGGVIVERDITDRKRAEDALRESEARLRAIVNTAADAIVTIDNQGLIESCNAATERMFDYPASALIGQNIAILVPWEDFDNDRDLLADSRATEERRPHTLIREVIGRRRDGSTLPIDLALSEFHAGSRRLLTGIIHDISERKMLQQELLSIAAAEQRRIGQDLHDDIGQELTGLTMKAETLMEIVTERQIPERDLAADIVAGLDRTRRKVQTLSRDMVPIEIDANGLVSSLEELTDRLGHLHHISCNFECRGPSTEIDTRVATQIYHIAQEAITNALKHAHPRTIKVTLDADESQLRLEVEDDGIGMANKVARRLDGMGLRIMSYRAGLIQGKLDVRSRDAGGTLVSCQIMRKAERGTNNPADPKLGH
jgi:two-component system CheB/CheR fusion protein